MSLRTILMAGGAICAAVVGGPVAAQQAIDGVAMLDAETVFQPRPRSVELQTRQDDTRRFEQTLDTPATEPSETRQLELEFAATGENAGVPIDVSVARRASLRTNQNGDIDGASNGSELRIGRNLVRRDDGQRQGSSVYVFVADDDEALTWSPGQGSGPNARGGGLALQDRVEVGDMSAGVTYERNGVQASLAYVEREISTQVGRQGFSQDENFAGVTVTMRH